MSKTVRKALKRRKPTKRFDATNMCKALEDMGFVRGFFSCLGIVLASEDGGPHFELDGEDLTVEVSLMPTQTQLTVRVGTVAGGPGSGIWRVPPVGAEVLVAVPDGDLDFQPTLASWYSSGSLPSDISESTLVIAAPAGGNIYLHDGSGNVDQLVTKSAYEAHTHGSPVGPTTVADNALDPASYTDVVRAK